MKSFILIVTMAVIFLATGCQKERFVEPQTPAVQQEDAIDYPTIQQKIGFDQILENAQKTAAAKARRQMCSVTTLFLDFEGQNNVAGAPWGIAGTFNCPTSGLTAGKKDSITAMVTEDYSPFNIRITRNEQEFSSASFPKMRIIVTRKTSVIMTSPILAPYPGVAYVSSILWNDDTPCFVFVNEFTGGDRFKKMAEAVSHELGHTFGLYHQGEPSINGEYRWPSEDLQNGAIMGNPYQAKNTRWIVGPSSSLGWQTQYDAGGIAAVTDWKDEPYSDVLNASTTPIVAGTIITATLVHADAQHTFQKITTGTKTAKLKSKGNGNFAILIYSSATDPNPVLVDPPNTNDVIISVTGKKFFKVVFVQPSGYAVSEAGASYTFQCN